MEFAPKRDGVLKNVKHVESLLASKRILAVGAHPDDVECGCGGTLARFSGDGSDIRILTFSKGEAGGNSGKRVKEAEKSAGILGAKLKIYGYPDTMLSSKLIGIVGVIEASIKTFKPDIVFTHNPFDVHQDHKAVYEATAIATRNFPCSVLCYENTKTGLDFKPTVFFNIDEFSERKSNAVKAHASQFGKGACHIDKICVNMRYRGLQSNVKYAEGFMPYRVIL